MSDLLLYTQGLTLFPYLTLNFQCSLASEHEILLLHPLC